MIDQIFERYNYSLVQNSKKKKGRKETNSRVVNESDIWQNYDR